MGFIVTDKTNELLASGEIVFTVPAGVLNVDIAHVEFAYQFAITTPLNMIPEEEERYVADAVNQVLGRFKTNFLLDPQRYAYRAKYITYEKVARPVESSTPPVT